MREIREYFMVHDAIWRAGGGKRGMLCVGCLETNIGRCLNAFDFTVCLGNQMYGGMSERLLDRLHHIPEYLQ